MILLFREEKKVFSMVQTFSSINFKKVKDTCRNDYYTVEEFVRNKLPAIEMFSFKVHSDVAKDETQALAIGIDKYGCIEIQIVTLGMSDVLYAFDTAKNDAWGTMLDITKGLKGCLATETRRYCRA